MAPIQALLAGAMSCLLLSGCIFGGGGREVRYDEKNRILVSFSSPQASRDFYEGLEMASHRPHTDAGGFFILFVGGGGGEVFYETQHYNAQVRRADVDRDGTITDEEASTYRKWMEEKAED